MALMTKEYDQVLREHFDLDDDDTRRVMLSINEADQNQVLAALTSKLYDHIVQRVDDIDFGDIPNTKGDITKLESYQKLKDCTQLMHDILVEYKQDLTSIKIIEEAILNVESRVTLFERGFKFQTEFVMITYSTIVLSIISSISFLIAVCIDFIKDPTADNFELTVDKVALVRTKENLLFSNLAKFNRSCDKEEIDHCLDYLMKNQTKGLTGLQIGVIGTIAIIGLLMNIVPILRELIFFFYYSRTRVSDYFDIQADLLQMNAYNVESNEQRDKKERQKIAAKQFKIVEMYRKISNALAVSNKENETKATKDITEDNKKYKSSEIVESRPDSASAPLF